MESRVLKAQARKIISANAAEILLVSIIYLIILTIISALAFRLPGVLDYDNFLERISSGEILRFTMIYKDFKPGGAVLALILYLFQPVLEFGYISYCVKTKRNRDAGYKDIFNGFQYASRVLLIFLITTIYIVLWSLLFVIPGIAAAYRYRLAYYILLDDPGKGALQCIEESRLMMNGGKLDLLIIDLSFFGWYLLDYIAVLLLPLPFALRILMIWVQPYRGMTNALFYEYRKNNLAV